MIKPAISAAICATLTFMPALAAPAPCGAPSRSAQKLMARTNLWQLGTLTAYEFSGGLAISPTATVPLHRYQTSGESLLGATAYAAGKYLLVTTTSRGYSIYLWDQSNIAAPSMQHIATAKLEVSDSGRTVLSPLVDVLADSSHLYLLGNFHLVVLKISDLVAGTHLPTSERIPGCDGLNQGCWRGVGLVSLDNQIVIAQMKHGETGQVRIGYARDFGDSPSTWNEVGATVSGRYTNILRARSAADLKVSRLLTRRTGADSVVLSGMSGTLKLDQQDYATAIAPISNNSSLSGMVTYQDAGSFLYSDGQNLCYAFPPGVRSAVAYRSGSSTVLKAIDRNDFLLTVVRND